MEHGKRAQGAREAKKHPEPLGPLPGLLCVFSGWASGPGPRAALGGGWVAGGWAGMWGAQATSGVLGAPDWLAPVLGAQNGGHRKGHLLRHAGPR